MTRVPLPETFDISYSPWTLEVLDWREIGPAYETRHHETGEIETRLPDSVPVLVLVNDDGRRWYYSGINGRTSVSSMSFEEARRFCDNMTEMLKARGVITLKYWNEERPVYGSPAYERDEGGWTQRDREDGLLD